jgi:hypothetical protein
VGQAGLALPENVPDDGEVGAEDAAQGLEDGVRAERDVVPREVGVTATEYYRETDGRNDAGPMLR